MPLINTKLPLDQSHFLDSHTIISTTDNSYTIELPIETITILDQSVGGGTCVNVALVSSIESGYDNPNKYKIDLQRVFHNVITVRMASSEIPNTAKAIRGQPPERANNKIYWNDWTTGDTLFSITIPPGNYTPEELEKKVRERFQKTFKEAGGSSFTFSESDMKEWKSRIAKDNMEYYIQKMESKGIPRVREIIYRFAELMNYKWQ
jgi:hypothetical protein